MTSSANGYQFNTADSPITREAVSIHLEARTPVPLNGKVPMWPDWQRFRFASEAEVVRCFTSGVLAGVNVGMLTGDGLADVDLDCSESLRAASRVLTMTPRRSGRAGALGSHHWYRIASGEEGYEKFTDADGSTLLELRADSGHQTMVPPSVHPESGERVVWECPPGTEPRSVELDDLRAEAAALAVVCTLGRGGRWPRSGSRHNAYLALAGGLLRGAPRNRRLDQLAGKIISALAHLTGDEERRVRSAEAVPTTRRKLAASENITGWTALAELLSDDGEISAGQIARRANRHAATMRQALGLPYPELNGEGGLGADGTADDGDGDTAGDGADRTSDVKRSLVLTKASAIKPRRVRWLWDLRIALGTLALLAGREGLGKSILAYTIAAMITRGELPGEHFGRPKAVLVAATEDSWSETIVPRLIAAGADLDLVFRIEVVSDGVHTELSLPRDLVRMRETVIETDAVLLILDPLISRLDDRLDTHRDSDTRRALEPLVAAAGQSKIAVLGLIHHNKSNSTDPLTVVMASKAFTAVARSVHTVVYDPDDDSRQRRLFGTPKNNLGRTDLPTLSFTIDSYGVEVDEDDGPATAWTGQLVWGPESTVSIHDVMEQTAESGEQRSAVTDAEHWLLDYLTSKGGTVPSATVKAAAHGAGHKDKPLRTARHRLKVEISEQGFPRSTWWSLPGVRPGQQTAQQQGQ